MKKPHSIGSSGFTLLEIIIVLLISTILAAMMLPYFGRNLHQSSAPIFDLQKSLSIVRVMENITADYKASNRSGAALTALKNKIDNGIFTTTPPFTTTTSWVDLDTGNANDPVTLRVTVKNTTNGEQLLALFTVH